MGTMYICNICRRKYDEKGVEIQPTILSDKKVRKGYISTGMCFFPNHGKRRIRSSMANCFALLCDLQRLKKALDQTIFLFKN